MPVYFNYHATMRAGLFMTERTNDTWIRDLTATGEVHAQALHDLRAFLLRGVMGYLRSRDDLSKLSSRDLEQLAQDTVQEAILKVQARLGTFEGKSKLTTWATKIAINLLISELRRRHWQNVSLQSIVEEGATLEEVIAAGPGDAGNPALNAERRSVWQAVVAVLENELTERQRQVLVMTQLNGLPLTVAADRLQTNTNNVYKLLHDARLKLKRALVSQGLEPEYIIELFTR